MGGSDHFYLSECSSDRKISSQQGVKARALKRSYALSGSSVMRSRTGTSWPFRSRSAVRARKMAPSSWR